jgi:hypothetical protein
MVSVTLRKRLEAHTPGLTPEAVLETLSGILMLDVHLPLADGRELVLPRYTQLRRPAFHALPRPITFLPTIGFTIGFRSCPSRP